MSVLCREWWRSDVLGLKNADALILRSLDASALAIEARRSAETSIPFSPVLKTFDVLCTEVMLESTKRQHVYRTEQAMQGNSQN